MIYTGHQGYVIPCVKVIEVNLRRELLIISQGLPTETDNEENVY